MENMTIREAARQLGITPQALRSRAKHRGISLDKVPGPHGDRYLVKAADLCFLGDETVSQNRSAEPSRETVSSRHGTVPHETVPRAHDTIPLAAHLEVIKLLRETQRTLQEAQEQKHQSLEAMRQGRSGIGAAFSHSGARFIPASPHPHGLPTKRGGAA